MDRARNSDIVRSRTEPWDIVVIGGGATGAGCALDAASRGFDVLLLEQYDFGKGTSSRSTKLVHGGVRYLAQGDISLVRESLHERGLLLRNAQHVVRTLPLVVPCYSVWQKIFYGTGLKVYDLLAGKYSLGRSKILSRRETLRRMPNLLEDGLRGGILYWDAQFDDTRLLIDILRTAETHGATVLNYARVASLKKNAGGRIDGVVVELDGDEIELPSRAVINATGPFCDPVRKLSDPAAKPVVRFSQGIHLVFDRRFIGSDTALMIPKTSDGRLLFCIPWNEHLLVGTTDTPIDSPEIEPRALETEIDFVLETAGSYLAQKPARADILSVFAGIRPLVNQREIDKTSSISRGHDLFVDDSGLITITGGKWTTYRKMGEDAVDTAIKAAELERRECITYDLPIEASKSVAGERLHPDLPYTRDDVIRAVREEMAVTLEDVLARRTRALFLNAKAAL
jgi:glycerol-3-phosphate dehydrogenase